MKRTIVLILLVFAAYFTQAQTKVFKEVNKDISSNMFTIKQDNALVGYLNFTKLEKANADSFHYQIDILDENLNNISKIEFKEVGLILEDISFDQDVLCLGYLKSNLFDKDYATRHNRKAVENSDNSVLMQFISLNGKIIKSNSVSVNILRKEWTGFFSKNNVLGNLKDPILVKNISQKGFACFFEDNDGSNLLVYNLKGELVWQKKIDTKANDFDMLTSGNDIYLLAKKSYSIIANYITFKNEGGYELISSRYDDPKFEARYELKDENGNPLEVLKFDNDVVTGKPYIAGYIIDPKKTEDYVSGKQLSRAHYLGIYVIDIHENSLKDVKKKFTYWADDSVGGVSKRGLFDDTESYALFTNAFRDFNGNTYFAGSELIRKPRWVAIGFSVVTAPLIIPPIAILGAFGTSKCKITDAMVVKLDSKGSFSVENTISSDETGYYRAGLPTAIYENKHFYTVVNADTKTNYLIVDDESNITIYNVKTKKVVRTVPHKEGKIKTYVFPAKEGHILVAEYNKKEKTKRLSIEAL